jgi:hypothetical protein
VLGTLVTTNVFSNSSATVNVGNAGSVAGVLGALNLENEPNYDTVNINDQSDTTTHTATIDTVTRSGDTSLGRLQGIGAAPITWDYFDTTAVSINFGGGTSTVNVLGTGVLTNLNGNPAGVNTLVGANVNTTWNITGANSGNFSNANAAASFTNFQNLTGGSGNDTFTFSSGATLSGTVNGGGGTNTLDYSAYTTSVLVDLRTGFATGVGGGVSNIGNVHGSNSSGSGLYNLLIGNGGNVLTGGSSRRNILVAGGSASTLMGGTQDDLLIGGTTSYDTETGLVSWRAIAAYWAGTDPFGTRVTKLESGSGVPPLNSNTVTGIRGGNDMAGSNELALIYTDGFDIISGFNAGLQRYAITLRGAAVPATSRQTSRLEVREGDGQAVTRVLQLLQRVVDPAGILR